ncbi:hypothetical protein HMSSN139_10410 [Paenibacillus sp. HMSSN-139]|nr:hypothetical protein HMSSN139_10410 [Paenibacillus sp. HMSSN-139]
MMSPEDGKAFVSYFPMPFASGARITVESEAEQTIKFYFTSITKRMKACRQMNCAFMPNGIANARRMGFPTRTSITRF